MNSFFHCFFDTSILPDSNWNCTFGEWKIIAGSLIAFGKVTKLQAHKFNIQRFSRKNISQNAQFFAAPVCTEKENKLANKLKLLCVFAVTFFKKKKNKHVKIVQSAKFLPVLISNIYPEIYCFCVISGISSKITTGEFYTGNKKVFRCSYLLDCAIVAKFWGHF